MSELLPWLAAPFAAALKQRRSHALLLHGPQGVGQFELALAIAAAWLCESPAGERPANGGACGRCTACRLIAARTHPDLLVLIPEQLQQSLGWRSDDAADEGEGGKSSKAKPSKEIKVDAVRAAIAFAQQTSSRGGVKAIVVHPAERMNPASTNMLLKTLEEPPGAARFLLSSAAPQRLLPTVRSRCQALRLPLPAAQSARDWLAAQAGAALDRPEVLLAAAGGQPLDALERLAHGIDASAWLRLPAEVRAGSSATLAGWPVPMVVDALQKLCHDALAAAVGAAPRFFPASAIRGDGDPARLTACAAALRIAARHAEHPWNAPLAAEALVQRVHRAWLADNDAEPARPAQGGLATLPR